MEDFGEVIKLLMTERRLHLSNPEAHGFRKNTRGSNQKSISASVSFRRNGKIQKGGIGLICYADQSPKETSDESKLVRAGIWKEHEVGKLWVYLNGQVYMLAKITPNEVIKINTGYRNPMGEYILDTEKADIA